MKPSAEQGSLIQSPHDCLHHSGWTLASNFTFTFPFPFPFPFPFTFTVTVRPDGSHLSSFLSVPQTLNQVGSLYRMLSSPDRRPFSFSYLGSRFTAVLACALQAPSLFRLPYLTLPYHGCFNLSRILFTSPNSEHSVAHILEPHSASLMRQATN